MRDEPAAPENAPGVIVTSIGLNTVVLLVQFWNTLNWVSLLAVLEVIDVPLLEGLPISRYPPILWLVVISNA